jgi:hypothetical protein
MANISESVTIGVVLGATLSVITYVESRQLTNAAIVFGATFVCVFVASLLFR